MTSYAAECQKEKVSEPHRGDDTERLTEPSCSRTSRKIPLNTFTESTKLCVKDESQTTDAYLAIRKEHGQPLQISENALNLMAKQPQFSRGPGKDRLERVHEKLQSHSQR